MKININKGKNIFLFSVDLEDVRMIIPKGDKYCERVPLMTEKYLEFLNEHKCKCTFFVVGKVAEKYPSLVKMIYGEGHEIACHSFEHKPITQMDAKSFKDDLLKNIESLHKAGIDKIYGFRAPTYSVTNDTIWAYDVLEELGFKYSSSVLPAKNPLYGWKDFGTLPKIISNVWEIPISLTGNKLLNIPFSGGVYFRVLPRIITNYYFRKYAKSEKPVSGYFHPYDIDTEQERFMHPGIHNSKIFNYLMYYGRKTVFKKLEIVINTGYKIIKYSDYYKEIIAPVKKNKFSVIIN